MKTNTRQKPDGMLDMVGKKGRSLRSSSQRSGSELLTEAMPARRSAQAKAKRLFGDDGASVIVNFATNLP
ncbi:hypothetical protein J2X04_000850 [Lysobacter niabensis]|uniref:Uncharacterized protein n=1 Tax=Agrilutibacter niabensis TaxID=380628 RepID=A0ABU1VN00_9GAMM|nr:hypothetical protein [Lysobacter niabensis]MDR7098503.1 hypothetical protein [Lysobacter niabensis]